MTDKKREVMIAEVMEGFDFENVHKVMQYMEWTWAIEHDEKAVPSVYRIMKQSERLLTEVSQYTDGERHEIATGGLRAILDENQDLELRFEIETSTSFCADYDEEGVCIYKE